MKPLPHLYTVKVEGKPVEPLTVSHDSLPPLSVAPPKDFGGPGDIWSPEDLLMAAIANCVVLSFRAIAKVSKLDWLSIECESSGVLDKIDRKTQFTEVTTKVILVIPSGQSIEKAERLLNKAEETCFVSNSLTATSHFECEVLMQ